VRVALPPVADRRRIREGLGLSRTALGRRLGVSGTLVRLWEAGARTPTAARHAAYTAELARAPRLCESCGLAPAPLRFKFCTTCSAQRCVECQRRAGQHHPRCPRQAPWVCPGCGGTAGRTPRFKFCATCLEHGLCPTCHRTGRNRHALSCLVARERRARPPQAGPARVSLDDIERAWWRHHYELVRLAACVVGASDAEDVLSQVIVRLLAARARLESNDPDYLHGYLRVSTRYAARTWRQRRARLTLAAEEDLILIEARARRRELGRRVALPPHAWGR
jgi:hypothetical protein